MQLAVRGQKAASSFLIASIPIALVAAFAALFIKSELNWFLRIPLVLAPIVF
jgi:ABC-type molybdate transport system permease subunit